MEKERVAGTAKDSPSHQGGKEGKGSAHQATGAAAGDTRHPADGRANKQTGNQQNHAGGSKNTAKA